MILSSCIIQRLASRNLDWAPARLRPTDQRDFDLAYHYGRDRVIRMFWAVFGLHIKPYRLLSADGQVLAMNRAATDVPKPPAEIFALRVWHEVKSCLGSFNPRLDTAGAAVLSLACDREHAALLFDQVPKVMGSDGRPVTRALLAISTRRRGDTAVLSRE